MSRHAVLDGRALLAHAAPNELVDSHGRRVRYLRLSVTDRCNLRCLYCWGCSSMRFIPHDDILRYEEMASLVDVAVEQGVEKLRLTGGEPFVRKGLMGLVSMLRKAHSHLDLRITTNGTMLKQHVPALKELGVSAVNVSLDTFRRDRFRDVTGRDFLPQVLEGMDALLDAGVGLKLNAVAMRGVNDDELAVFIDYARTRPVDVRFIEFMPMGCGTRWSEANFWSATDILAEAQQLADLDPVEEGKNRRGPARLFSIRGGLGRLGLITPMSNHFCNDCNRLRVTSDGRLRTCLFADREYRLRPLLRHKKLGLDAVRRVVALATRQKPIGYALLQQRAQGAVAERKMTAIGG